MTPLRPCAVIYVRVSLHLRRNGTVHHFNAACSALHFHLLRLPPGFALTGREKINLRREIPPACWCFDGETAEQHRQTVHKYTLPTATRTDCIVGSTRRILNQALDVGLRANYTLLQTWTWTAEDITAK